MRDLVRETGARVHIVHVGTGRAADVIAEARSEGLPMSGETCPHFLEFTADDLARQGGILKTAPVVKSAADRDRLWQAVEILLPYLYSEGVRKGRITLERLVEITAAAPARFFGVEKRKGRLAPGFDADFVVFEEDETWTVRAAALHSMNRYTPHAGQTFTGRVRSLHVRGERAYHRAADGTESFAAPGTGRWVRRETRVGA